MIRMFCNAFFPELRRSYYTLQIKSLSVPMQLSSAAIQNILNFVLQQAYNISTQFEIYCYDVSWISDSSLLKTLLILV